MKNSLLGCVFFLSTGLSACVHFSDSRGPASSPGPLPISKQEIPDSGAITRWQNVDGYQSTPIDVMTLPSVPVSCADQNLYPTHPQQTTKLYHQFLAARYSEQKLTANDTVCKIGSKYKNTSGMYPCLAADYGEYAVISDTYQDACGHYYRGVWDVFFLKRDDNMGMLFAKGRTLYQKPHSDYPNDMYVAQTYPVDVKDFLIVTSLFPGDREEIEKQRQDAQATHIYDPQKLIFTPKM